ncbi:hypothetical protein Tco_0227282 [Tanacetum coccineum]
MYVVVGTSDGASPELSCPGVIMIRTRVLDERTGAFDSTEHQILREISVVLSVTASTSVIYDFVFRQRRFVEDFSEQTFDEICPHLHNFWFVGIELLALFPKMTGLSKDDLFQIQSCHDLDLEALDNKHIGEDFIISSIDIVYKLVRRLPLNTKMTVRPAFGEQTSVSGEFGILVPNFWLGSWWQDPIFLCKLLLGCDSLLASVEEVTPVIESHAWDISLYTFGALLDETMGGTAVTGVLGGLHVNAESGFGTEVSAFFLSFSSMDQNICSGGQISLWSKGCKKLSQPYHECPLSHAQQDVHD